MVRTHIGYGSPNKHDSFEAHGSPLGPEETRLTKENLGWPADKTFYIPKEALDYFRAAGASGEKSESGWTELMRSYGASFPELMEDWELRQAKKLPEGWDRDIPVFKTDKKGISTRAAGGKVLNAVAPRVPSLMGGSGDLDPSTKTKMDGRGQFEGITGPGPSDKAVQGAVSGGWGYGGANVAFGVREHAMGSITTGLALHGGILPYASTFLIFSDYMRPAIRLAALGGVRVIYVFTHDSVAVGEDGPTHQPVEHLAALRAMPGLKVIRPADANETAEAWKAALTDSDGPVALILTRQDIPVFDRPLYAPAENLHRGGYVLAGPEKGEPRLIIMASGSEVHLALAAREALSGEGIEASVVSMPCQELFDVQDVQYKKSVLPPGVKIRLAVEAGSTQGWHKYVGGQGAVIGIDRFGASAKGEVNMQNFGFTAGNIIATAKELLKGEPGK
jgi:transketolase